MYTLHTALVVALEFIKDISDISLASILYVQSAFIDLEHNMFIQKSFHGGN